jgi:hypothetical protein
MLALKLRAGSRRLLLALCSSIVVWKSLRNEACVLLGAQTHMGGEKTWRKNGKKARTKEPRTKNGKKKSGKPSINASFLFLLF